MKFSVIIPTYNRQSLVTQAINSALAQTHSPHEIIVVDDGSTDRTATVLANYGERIQLLRIPNSGPGAARNAGLHAASGDYVAFLDSDDLWFPWTLSSYAEAIAKYHQPAFVTGTAALFRCETELATVTHCPLKIEAFDDYFASGDAWRWFGVSSFVVRRDVLLSVGGFSADLANAEDADLALKLGASSGFVHLSAPHMFGYREHAANLTADMERGYRGVFNLIERESRGEYPGNQQRSGERRRILTRHVRPAALACLRGGHASRAWSIYRRTFAWHLQQSRLKFLLGFPLLALVQSVGLGTAQQTEPVATVD